MGLKGGVREVLEEWSPVIVMAVTNTAMGSVNALVKKALDVGVNHMIVGAYRMAISALILIPFAYILERRSIPKITLRLLVDHFISAILGASVMQFFFLLGLSYTSATVSCVIVSLLPAITFALALVFRVESVKSKAGVLKLMGTFICISGALFITFYKGPQISNPWYPSETLHHNNIDKVKTKKYWLLGCLYLTIGTTMLSIWMLLQANLSVKYPCKYASTCLMSIFAAFQCALLSLYKTRNFQDWIIEDRFVILVIVYAGVIGQAMSTVTTSWSINKRGAVFGATFGPVTLMSATIFDFFILHIPLYLGSGIGSVVAIFGLYMFLWGKSKEKKPPTILVSQFKNEDQEINYNNNNNIVITSGNNNNKNEEETRSSV